MKFKDILTEQLTVDPKQVKAALTRITQDVNFLNNYVKDLEKENENLKQGIKQTKEQQLAQQKKQQQQQPTVQKAKPFGVIRQAAPSA